MEEIINDPLINKLITSLVVGEVNLFTGFIWLIIATFISMAGGAIGGLLIARKHLGYELSAILGGFFGPAGVIPTILLGLAILNIFTQK
ncbi:hypothetical protein [Brunnivagina elsteri]|uniref:Uncharacterized protein n=1 Tax=Brunnivagina elsteri CCALA 953 TaxID=987040 RepID=A0A2A2TEV2_9CYAN|nr:hypothetical protein [Calothrix elsteri]PAX52165.1 hypothetical protein CK510_20805 [Calothrix elsteri CCALA 953]